MFFFKYEMAIYQNLKPSINFQTEMIKWLCYLKGIHYNIDIVVNVKA